MKKLSVLLILVSSLYACDKIEEGKYRQKTSVAPTSDSTTTSHKKVLLEDFTGHLCGNCPKGGEVAEAIHIAKGDSLVLISVHAATLFSQPIAGKYATDFRTPAGTELNSFFGFSEYPNGMVNRSGGQGKWIKGYSEWATVVNTLLSTQQTMDISISNTYTASDNTIKTTIQSKSLVNYPNPVKLVVVMTEDSIKDYQKDDRNTSNPDIADFYHRYVLRASITSTFGDTLGTGGPSVNKKFSKGFTYTLKPNWKPEHCRVVAYIYDALSYEVLQAEEKKIK